MVKLARQETSLRPYVNDTVAEIHQALSNGRNVMVEGTQGTFLSLYHGTYPYVTSKDVTASQACADVGIGPTDVDDVIIIFKAYVTRVGEGPLLEAVVAGPVSYQILPKPLTRSQSSEKRSKPCVADESHGEKRDDYHFRPSLYQDQGGSRWPREAPRNKDRHQIYEIEPSKHGLGNETDQHCCYHNWSSRLSNRAYCLRNQPHR